MCRLSPAKKREGGLERRRGGERESTVGEMDPHRCVRILLREGQRARERRVGGGGGRERERAFQVFDWHVDEVSGMVYCTQVCVRVCVRVRVRVCVPRPWCACAYLVCVCVSLFVCLHTWSRWALCFCILARACARAFAGARMRVGARARGACLQASGESGRPTHGPPKQYGGKRGVET